ncbi:MAG: hypothetical protein SchgKO_16390 [Schleiferiaceae bacterium]
MNYFLSSLLLGAGILSSPFSQKNAPESELLKEKKPEPELILELQETDSDEYVEIVLWINNTTEDTLILAPCSDGTFVGWIEPTVSFQGWGLVRGKWLGLEPQIIARCGNHDSRWWTKEMINLPPGEKTKIGSHWIRPKTFFVYRDAVERVKISATYSLGKVNPEKAEEYGLSSLEITSNTSTMDL